ncbi:hypothetical protein [Bradyrhizobium sp. Cp5.3]|uniref:hypothetical protein n=1 Tax=Bradyrhizobium sp. Cp5.3 TaxID=443598 RepID=UPI0004885391|nr:hypothetical protein [Bradyrhizobium sp. Cp5.3]
MKLIGSTVGRCLKLFAWEEVRPTHGVNSAILATALAEQFNFQIRPTPPISLDQVVKFGDGAVIINGTMIAIQKFDIYSDGYAVDCSNTDDAKLVSDEIWRWAQSDLGFRDFIRPPNTIYLSQVTVEFAPEFENIFKGWKKLQDILNESAQKRYGFSQDVNVLRVQWRGDAHTLVNNTLVSDFWIERKAGEPYATNRWHCHGVLPTNEWLSLLETIEAMAIGD